MKSRLMHKMMQPEATSVEFWCVHIRIDPLVNCMCAVNQIWGRGTLKLFLSDFNNQILLDVIS